MKFKASLFLAVGLILILNFQASALAAKRKLRFCVVMCKKTADTVNTLCPKLDEFERNVECVVKNDRLSCMKLLKIGEIDFMIAEPQDLVLLGTTDGYNENIRVTHELRLRLRESDRSNTQMVVVIYGNTTINPSADYIRKEGLCSLGLDKSIFLNDYAEYAAHLFSSPKLKCSANETITENRLTAVFEVFSSACLSGAWNSDPAIDMDLKEKYPDLCEQCYKKDCRFSHENYGHLANSFCMTNKRGNNLAWIKLESVRENLMFKRDNYFFLCRNYTTLSLATSDPCTWLEEPWKTIVARKEISEDVQRLLNYDDYEEESDFLKVFQQDKFRKPIHLEILRTPNDYLNTSFREFYSSKDNIQCKPERYVKWCVTTNIEAEKCQWLSKAADSYGIGPFIKCVKETSRENCIQSVINGKNDIFSLQPHEYMEAQKNGLMPVMHMVPENNFGQRIVAIIRKSSNFSSLQDLENHQACFAGFRDPGWNAFVYIMKHLTGDNSWYTDDKKMVSQFFNETCIADLNENNTTLPRNLYSLCSNIYNMSDYENQDHRALDCLISGGGDVAFVNLSSIMNFYPDAIIEKYQTIVANGRNWCEIGMDNECYLTWTTPRTIMMNVNISRITRNDVIMMLKNLDHLFGEYFVGPTPFINLYRPFEKESDVIFSDKTMSMRRTVNGAFRIISYTEILKELTLPSASEVNSPSQKIFSIMLLSFLYFWTM